MAQALKIPLYQVDAFTSRVFSGNPAAVCFLEAWLEDATLQRIAAENNLSETAFLVRSGDGYELRWFTPALEVDLCGHATLASAFVLFEHRNWPGETIRFSTRKSGLLSVSRRDGLLEMDFPSRAARPTTAPPALYAGLGAAPLEVHSSAEDLLVVLEDENAVRSLKPDWVHLEEIDCRGIIVTARSKYCDFVSRFFAPRVGIPEDPVTGSAHCVLIPYWSARLGKKTLHALQVSARGGELFCEDRGARVGIAGRAALYLEGAISL